MSINNLQSDSLVTLNEDLNNHSESDKPTTTPFTPVTTAANLTKPRLVIDGATIVTMPSLSIAPISSAVRFSTAILPTKTFNLKDVMLNCVANEAPKPRRRSRDTKPDYADGLEVLIQKTKAINMHEDLSISALGDAGASWYESLASRSGDSKLPVIRKIRKFVCGDASEAHAQQLIASPLLNMLMWYLEPDTPEPELFETLWILTNIAAGPTSHTTKIVDLGFLPHIVRLLKHRSGPIRTQAAWTLGNVVGDREGFRDRVLQEGTLPAILTIWQGEFNEEFSRKEAFRIAMWVVDNMCRYKPDWHQMAPAFEALPQVLNERDPYLLKECCWAIARILHQSGRHPAIDCMITKELCIRLIDILHLNNMLTSHPILRALINLSSSKNPIHVQNIVDAGLLNEMSSLLSDHLLPKSCRDALQVFAMQVVGNISSQPSYILNICQTELLFMRIVTHLRQRDNAELRVEACYCVRNLVFHRDETVTKALVNLQILPVLLEYLEATVVDSKNRLATVEAIGYILEVGDAIGTSSFPLARIKNKRQIASKYKGGSETSRDSFPIKRNSGSSSSPTTPTSEKTLTVAMANLSKSTASGGKVAAKRNRLRGDLGNLEDLGSDDDSPITTPRKSHRYSTMPRFAINATVANNPFMAELNAVDGFQQLLDALVATSGRDLDQMDEDGPDIEEIESEDDETDHEDSDAEASEAHTVHIDKKIVSRRGKVTPVFTIKQTTASRLHTILMRWFPEQFYNRIEQAHETSLVMASMNGLNVGGNDGGTAVGGFEGALLELVRDFGMMKSNTGGAKQDIDKPSVFQDDSNPFQVQKDLSKDVSEAAAMTQNFEPARLSGQCFAP
ncbi:hypothetical protein QVD99_000909 [Batrachochytrium dendrobatidis]|nr:hypothetical protein O5D80_003760 [Batrachochytrium dendrobatidis]KAK5673464.1 hypothetical protein QVD99_000909 [Batrachochytrium dendrobatidis]